MECLTVDQLFNKLRETLGLRLVTDSLESASDVVSVDVSLPGLLLAGFDRGFRPERVQLLGDRELSYLESLADSDRGAALDRLCVQPVPCVVVADGRSAPAELIERGNARRIPVFESEMACDQLARRLSARLEELLAPSTTVHGTLVDVYGVGLLFTGKSGIGKSECGLDLVENGHRLVADDVVHVVRTPRGHLIGSGNDLLRHYMEIRGVGIIDVQSMFGVRAIRQRKRIEVEVELVSWSELEDYERLGIEEAKTELLGVEIPHVTLPLVTGKNITVISEVIALNHLLKLRGIHAAREFDQRLKDLASRKFEADEILQSDNE